MDFDYYFEQRGLVAVKGKGQLMTYYLLGRNDRDCRVSVPIFLVFRVICDLITLWLTRFPWNDGPTDLEWHNT